MQSKIIGGAFAFLWTGMCYYAGYTGRGSETQTKDNFPTEKIQMAVPQSSNKLMMATLTAAPSVNIVKDTFVEGVVQAPFQIIDYPHFKILYSTYHKCPLAVHERITKTLIEGNAKREPKFKEQEKITQPRFRCTNKHYQDSKASLLFDISKGHMAPASNYSGDQTAKTQTFTLANIVPQNQHNNDGIWNTFQRYSRNLLTRDLCQSVQIINGPIYYKKNPYQQSPIYPLDQKKLEQGKYKNIFKQQSIVLLQNGVVVPQKLYKIIKCNTKTGQSYVDAFQFWNKKLTDLNDTPLKDFSTSISSIQDQTGLKFNFSKAISAGKPPLLKSLIQFDKEAFQKPKKFYEQEFFKGLMKKQTKIQGINMFFARAKSQKIFIPLNQFDNQVNEFFKKQIKQQDQIYKKNPQQSACFVLYKLMKLNKNLSALYQLNSQKIKTLQQFQNSGPLEICLSKTPYIRGEEWRKTKDKKDEKYKNLIVQNRNLNLLTKAITKSEAEVQKKEKNPLIYINQQKLKAFIIPGQLQKLINSQSSQINGSEESIDIDSE